MLEDWFQTLEFPMSLAKWRCLPRNAAYKYEYIEGQAQITPEPPGVDVVLELKSFAPTPPDDGEKWTVRPLTAGDWELLPDVMAAAFARVAPFATFSDHELGPVAADCIAATRAGKDGSLLPEACMALLNDSAAATGEPLVGAAIVTVRPGETIDGPLVPLLTWIFVNPWVKRRGGGVALLWATVAALRSLSHSHLESVVCPGNHATIMWHWKMGFAMGPTIRDKVRRRFAQAAAKSRQ